MSDSDLQARANLYALQVVDDLQKQIYMAPEATAQLVARAVAMAFVVGFGAGMEECAKARHGR